MKLSHFIGILFTVGVISVSCTDEVVDDIPNNSSNTTDTTAHSVDTSIVVYSGLAEVDCYFKDQRDTTYAYVGHSLDSLDFSITVINHDTSSGYFYFPAMPPTGVIYQVNFINGVAEHEHRWTHPSNGTEGHYLHIRAELTSNGIYLVKDVYDQFISSFDSCHYEGYLYP